VIVGPNGQGKTNLLEAVYLLATLKPLRAARLPELVRFGADRAEVRGRFELGGAVRDIGVTIEDGERKAFVGGKPVRELDEYFGGVSVVAFTPDDLAIVKGGPEGRRRWLDRATWGRFPAYLAEARAYARALRARNRLLREGAAPDVVEAFDGPLARAGARLVVRRRRLLDELHPRFEAALVSVSDGALEGRVRYAPSWLEGAREESEVEERLAATIRERLPRDRERGFTGAGPHADQPAIFLAGKPAKTYASQGQQRALVLALKIAEIENLRAAQGAYPLLLLDDVSSELDRERNRRLLAYLAGLDGQVLLTTTDPGLVAPAVGPDGVFLEVREGTFTVVPREGFLGEIPERS
jgi:DNA replication and repair protein RecF